MSNKNKLLTLFRNAGILRPRDLDGEGIPRECLRRLCNEGVIKRIGRGLYSLVDADLTEAHDYVSFDFQATRLQAGSRRNASKRCW